MKVTFLDVLENLGPFIIFVIIVAVIVCVCTKRWSKK